MMEEEEATYDEMKRQLYDLLLEGEMHRVMEMVPELHEKADSAEREREMSRIVSAIISGNKDTLEEKLT